ncbi:uncharacterized protein LOC129290436 [Prosopis cineraria]|uniref:uncharacterized protein LOC129290436 n=1 Tax=Prosopis cineraria TaxID=364024 RepID=UPI0024100FCC|nr:uncharacterized protein LOC129290436 [Prosopis cineraria]XP_054783176.1 uncharacterized protein LOC129290436 [Prosopis cineraria]XP_054783177.1 uncharacterized protein LOC129290436 [Prosopis cineraria]
MNKLLEFGRKALFYVRVLSGYEQWRIRSCRLQLEKRLLQAQERKEAVRKIPEQIILFEVRRMVEEMQSLDKKLEETEATIQEYFKPIDKEAEIIMKMQLEEEEKTMTEMMKTMQQQTLLEEAKAGNISSVRQAEESLQANQKNPIASTATSTTKEDEMR